MTNIIDTLTYRALVAVKGDCDGARSDDGKGFSGYDAGFAHDLIAKAKFGWSERQFAAAQRLAVKYRKQAMAKDASFTPEAIMAETAPARAAKPVLAPVPVEVCIGAITDKAFFVDVLPQHQRFGKRLWLPQSVITFPEGRPGQGSVEPKVALIAAWFADREGLNEYRVAA
jgi:hypothetical protein